MHKKWQTRSTLTCILVIWSGNWHVCPFFTFYFRTPSIFSRIDRCWGSRESEGVMLFKIHLERLDLARAPSFLAGLKNTWKRSWDMMMHSDQDRHQPQKFPLMASGSKSHALRTMTNGVKKREAPINNGNTFKWIRTLDWWDGILRDKRVEHTYL